MSEIEIQTSETIETLEKKERNQSEQCAKLQEYRAIARERDEWKKGEPSVTGGSGDNEILGGIQGHTPQDKSTGAVYIERARGSSADTTVCSQSEEHDTRPF